MDDYNIQIKKLQRSPNVLTLDYEDIILEKVDIRKTLQDWLQTTINDIYISRPFSAEVSHKQKGFDKNRATSYRQKMPQWAQFVASFLFG